jgi:glycosyltransferase involved in cell wall biosynthesis
VSEPFDVIVPTYNNRHQLAACLDSLAESTVPIRALVCVDGSTDDTSQYLESSTFRFPVEVLTHRDGANHGRGPARNLALPHLRSEFVLFLDSDMRLDAQALARHLTVVTQNVVSIGNVVYDNARNNAWAGYQATRGKNKAKPGARVRGLDFNTQNVALRSADLVALGGFDESLTGYGGEDTELGIRLELVGRTFVFTADAKAYTVENKTIDEGLSQLRRYAQTNLRAIRRKHPDGPAPFMVDRAESARLLDRAFRLVLNPLTDRLVDLLLPRAPWAFQRRLLNYNVIRTVFAGYREGTG